MDNILFTTTQTTYCLQQHGQHTVYNNTDNILFTTTQTTCCLQLQSNSSKSMRHVGGHHQSGLDQSDGVPLVRPGPLRWCSTSQAGPIRWCSNTQAVPIRWCSNTLPVPISWCSNTVAVPIRSCSNTQAVPIRCCSLHRLY